MPNDNKSLDFLKQRLSHLEPELRQVDWAELTVYYPDDRKPIRVFITGRLKKNCSKGKVWKSKEMLTALKNASYGFDLAHARSPGGYDGIFLLTRDYKPKNEMMRKLFDRFIDKTGSGAEEVARNFGCALTELLPVRLVSHHMRLLGLLHQGSKFDDLILVDYDDTKH